MTIQLIHEILPIKLSCRFAPEGAGIYYQAQQIGQGSVTNFELETDTIHVLEIKLEGFHPLQKRIEIHPGLPGSWAVNGERRSLAGDRKVTLAADTLKGLPVAIIFKLRERGKILIDDGAPVNPDWQKDIKMTTTAGYHKIAVQYKTGAEKRIPEKFYISPTPNKIYPLDSDLVDK
jgi:hypothetical protein